MKTSSPGQVKWKQVCKTRGVYAGRPKQCTVYQGNPSKLPYICIVWSRPKWLVLRTHCCFTVSFSFKFKVFWYKFTKKGSRKFSGFLFTANLTGFISLLSFNQTIRRTQRNDFMLFSTKMMGHFCKNRGHLKKMSISLLTITYHVFFFHGECGINLHLPTGNSRASGKLPDCNLFRAPRALRCNPCLLWDVV